MLGIDPEFGASALRMWIAAGATILLILFCILTLSRRQPRIASSPAKRTGLVLVGALLGGVMTWGFFDSALWSGGSAERRVFAIRAQQLNALALAPGSPLACLDAVAGESVATACEKVLFASPASVASASSYVAAQLALLSSIAAYERRGGADIEAVLVPLRRSLEADRFGFVAHVLAVRDGCSVQNCRTLALFRDPNRLRANLSVAMLDRYLERYMPLWAAGPEAPVAEAGSQAQPAAAVGASPNGQGAHKVVNIDFPSAASIPPVSIMNPEPSGPVLPGVAAAAAANPNPSSSHHARKQAASPPAATVAGQSGTSTAVEPIWPEPMPAPPHSALTPGTAPVQLTPAPNASAGALPRSQ